MSKAAFISRLELDLPETSRILAQHRGFTDGEPKLELILSDLRSLSAVWFHVGNVDAYGRLRALLDQAMTNGDQEVHSAMRVAFVGALGHREGESAEYIESLPFPILIELSRQQLSGDWRNQPEIPLRPEFRVTVGPPGARVYAPIRNDLSESRRDSWLKLTTAGA